MSTDRMFKELRSSTINAESRPATRDSLAYVKVGSHIKLRDQIFRVDDISYMQETNKKFSKSKPYRVTEFTVLSLSTGETRYIEWAYDDELEISFTERKVKAVELGFNPSKIESKDSISIDGVSYGYEEKWYGIFSKDQEAGHNVVLYEYEACSGDMLTFEGWVEGVDLNDVDYEVFISSPIGADSLELC